MPSAPSPPWPLRRAAPASIADRAKSAAHLPEDQDPARVRFPPRLSPKEQAPRVETDQGEGHAGERTRQAAVPLGRGRGQVNSAAAVQQRPLFGAAARHGVRYSDDALFRLAGAAVGGPAAVAAGAAAMPGGPGRAITLLHASFRRSQSLAWE